MPGKTYTAIGALAAIAITAIICDFNGIVVIPIVTAIAGLGGYAAGKIRK